MPLLWTTLYVVRDRVNRIISELLSGYICIQFLSSPYIPRTPLTKITCCGADEDTPVDTSVAPDMAMGWVDPWVGLGRVGSRFWGVGSSSVKYDSLPKSTALVNIIVNATTSTTDHFYI